MEQRRLGLINKAMLVVPGHCLGAGGARVPGALSERPHSRRRRDEFREGEAPPLPVAGRDRQLGRDHHHAFGLQVHPRPVSLRAANAAGRTRGLRGAAHPHRLAGSALAQARRAHEGGPQGAAGGARVAQGRPAHDLGDRYRPDHRRRGAGVPEALLRHQYDVVARRRSKRLAARLGPIREVPLRRHEEPRPRARARFRHADHQHARRNVHRAAADGPRGAARARPARVRRMGVHLRRHVDRTRAAALRQVPAGDALRAVRQRPRTDRHVPLLRRRGAAGGPARAS